MSSIKDDFNHFYNSNIVIQEQNPLKIAKNEAQRRKNIFISDLMSLLFHYKRNKEIYSIISHLIIISLKSQIYVFLDKIFSDINEMSFSNEDNFDHLLILRKMHTFLFRSFELTDKERLDFFHLERFFIKQYLEHASLLQ